VTAYLLLWLFRHLLAVVHPFATSLRCIFLPSLCYQSSAVLPLARPRTPGGAFPPRALRRLRPRGQDRRGAVLAGRWLGARGSGVLRGGGWRRDAVGDTSSGGTPDRTSQSHVVVLVARCCARARTRQTGALTRGRRYKPARGLSEGPPSCYYLRFECVVGQRGRVLRTHSPGGKRYPKSLMGSRVGGGAHLVGSAREWVADARRLVSMSRPSFGGVGALRGGDHDHQHGHQHLRQEARVPAPGGLG
jgi:hypothetical protein